MQKGTYLLVLLIFIHSKINSQIKVIDSDSEKGIAFVEIYSSNGDLIGLTDINGYIDDPLFRLIRSTITGEIVFNHLTYDELAISKPKLMISKEVKLNQNTITLNDVTVTDKRNRSNRFIKLHGFYRSYQINNGEIKYYTDGLISYYLPLTGNNRIRNKLLHNRSFINKELEKKDKRRINTVYVTMAGYPRPDKRLTSIFLKKKYTFSSNGQEIIIKRNKKEVGAIQPKQNSNVASLKIAFVDKDNAIEKKLFGYRSIIDMHNGLAYFKTKKMDSFSLENLLYHKEIRKLRFKHKKDIHFEQIESLHEFFVTKIELIEKVKDNNLSKWFGFNRSSSYNSQYWKEFYKHPFYKPLPKNIEKQLGIPSTEFDN